VKPYGLTTIFSPDFNNDNIQKKKQKKKYQPISCKNQILNVSLQAQKNGRYPFLFLSFIINKNVTTEKNKVQKVSKRQDER